MANFKIYTLGCKVNQYDSGGLSRKMLAAGFKVSKKDADVVIINTCCVTKTAISKCKRMVNKARKENPVAKIVVMGCWPAVYRDEVEKLNVGLIWGVGELAKLIKRIKILCDNRGIAAQRKRNLQIPPSLLAMTDRSRYFIKIQDGCEQFCSYCIIPYSRGKLKSRSIKEVVDEVRQAVKAGYREVVLCGIHLGLYGYKSKSQIPNPKNSLAELLKRLIKIKDLGRIRLSSIEVTEVSDELIKLIADSDKICQHLHIPLQSGSDRILKLMNRPYNIKYFAKTAGKLRKIMPNVAVTTDVIVGFPGETEDDFRKTYNFVKEMQFSRLHVFPFSAHERTPAAKLSGKVKREETEKRVRKLRKLGKKLERDYRKRFVGQELQIALERRIEDARCLKGSHVSRYKGKSEYYFDVEFGVSQITTDLSQIAADNEAELVGKIVRVKV